MSEPDISTLARRLAEQNNVDWRALGGSGPDGKVVERDVLDYLARVMAGEEATNPTPEPLPAGMEVWPDQDLDTFRSGVASGAGETAGSLGDLRDELGRAVRDEDPSAAPTSTEAATDDVFAGVESVPFGAAEGLGDDPSGADRQSDAAGVDEDIFLFDDDASDAASASAVVEGAANDVWGVDDADEDGAEAEGDTAASPFAEAASDAAVGSATDDLDDLLVAGEELFEDDEAADATSGVTPAGTSDGMSDVISDVTAPTGLDNDLGTESDQAAAHVPDASDFGELSTAGFEERDDGLGLGEDHEADFGSTGSGAAEPEGEQAEDTWGSNIALGDDSNSFGGSASAAAEDDATDLWGEPQQETAAADDLWSAGTAAGTAEAAAADDAVFGEESPWGSHEATSAPSEMQAPADPWSSGIGSADTVANDETFGGVEQGAGTALAAGAAADDAATPVAGDALDVGTAVAGNLPLTRSATILRRHIDLSALASSQVSVGNELGFDEPLGVGPFLLRAVAKAAGALDVSSEHVALAVLGDGLRLRRVSDAAQRSFSSLVGELAEEVVEEDEPRLVAADLSVLDLDEALLDLEVPVVTLGRILYDNQRGAYRSTLTLTGAVHPDAGARLLARVAELLDAPVRLVL